MITAYKNAHGNWKAEHTIDIHDKIKHLIVHGAQERIKLSVVTMKRSNGMLTTSVSLGHHQEFENHTSVSTSPFSDFNATLERTEVRATKRSVEVQHSRYLIANESERIVEAALSYYANKKELSDV